MLRIGTRGSRLAVWQAEFVKTLLVDKFPKIAIDIRIIKTTGDKTLDSPVSSAGGKGIFVKEIEEALLKDEIDIAVHSLKDLPSLLPSGLSIGAIPQRADPRDVLVSKKHTGFDELPEGSRVGTGSLRRKSLLLNLRPDIEVVPIRGNVDTRIRKLKEGENYDALLLAGAGLERMGLQDEITEIFPEDVIVPAPGQGAVAVECREDDEDTRQMIFEINHEPSGISVSAERAFLRRVSGDCNVPVGCFADVRGNGITILGVIASPDGTRVIRDRKEGAVESSESLGAELAEKILRSGGEEILKSLSP